MFFELGDHLGSTSVVLDKATGELVERSTYQAYGGTESDYRPERWKSFREDYRFTGKEEDVEVGLVYFGKRFLNPLLNRWISADPLAIHGLGADPNLYAYVSGRVLQSVDPLGLQSVFVQGAAVPQTPAAMDQARLAYGRGKQAGENHGRLSASADQVLDLLSGKTGHTGGKNILKSNPDLAKSIAKNMAGQLFKAMEAMPRYGERELDRAAKQGFVEGSQSSYERAKFGLAAQWFLIDVAMGGFAGAAESIARGAATRILRTTLRQGMREVGAHTIATMSRKARGPVLAGVLDIRTGKAFFAINQAGLPEKLHPILSARIDKMKAAHHSIPGSHAEVHALNDALWAREKALGKGGDHAQSLRPCMRRAA